MDVTLKSKLAALPQTPGIYQFLNKNKEVIYIGKAKKIAKRVKSYFQKKETSIRQQKMCSLIRDIKYIVTNSELEAIILETNLIKELKPKYNILMKDDKNYVYLKITTNEDFPTISIVRRIEKDHEKYFGPKTSAKKIETLLEFCRKMFPVRNCHLGIKLIQDFENSSQVQITKKTINYPCLEYHIKRCAAPCIGVISKTRYQNFVNSLIQLFNGDTADIENMLKKEIAQCVKDKNFERAIPLRNKLQTLRQISERQLVQEPSFISRDVINYVLIHDDLILAVINIRKGKMINQEIFEFSAQKLNDLYPSDILESLLTNYYQIAADIPDEIVIPHQISNPELMSQFLSQEKNKKVSLIIPKIGTKDHLLEFARKNALIHVSKVQKIHQFDKHKKGQSLQNLQNLLGIKSKLNRIEAYDISHLGGNEVVGSMIVFNHGQSSSSDYRRFKLKSVQGRIDDYAALKEVLFRRLKYLPETQNTAQQSLIYKKANQKELKNIYQETKAAKIQNKQHLLTYICTQKNDLLASVKIENIGNSIGFVNDLNLNPHFSLPNSNGVIQKLFSIIKAHKLYAYPTEDQKNSYFSFGFREVKKIPSIFENKIRNKAGIKMRHFNQYNDKSFANRPDLIIIDGGRGQLNSVREVLKNLCLQNIPLIAIAKKNEEIYLPDNQNPICLEKNNPILHLIQRMRDEAHRFAITYHKHLRDKTLFQI